MKILYAAGLASGSASLFRKLALERLGHQLVTLNSQDYKLKNELLHKVSFRLAAGPHARRLNRDLLKMAEQERPDVFWADKLLLLQPGTLRKMSALGIKTVSYMIDNPFGPRKDPGWRLYVKDIPYFDLHVQQRDVSIAEYKRRGARDVVKVLIGFEPTMHFPSPVPLTDAHRDRDASFIGTPYDNRAEILTKLSEDNVPLAVSGATRAWKRALREDVFTKVYREGELFADAYREGIWRSKINISFLTKSNQDEYTQKSFEIAGCGGFLLAERSSGHSRCFVEDEEAVFFDGYEELKAKILKYLPDEAARTRIAKAGQLRAERDGYNNDHQMEMIMERIERELVGKDHPGVGR